MTLNYVIVSYLADGNKEYIILRYYGALSWAALI